MSENFVLVIGGAASGKSKFAEALIDQSGLTKTYLATARALDDEMRDKVARHKTQRGDGWQTVETPLDPSTALASLSARDAVLLDCATMWLTNHMMEGTDLERAETQLLDGLSKCPAYRVVVTNDLSGGLVPADPFSRSFRQAQGELNQRLAAAADSVVYVIAGLPQVLKGAL